MLITYFIFLIIAIVFKLLHFPGTALLFMIGPIILLIDLVVQAIRKQNEKANRILSAFGALFLSLFLQFKFLYWSGSQLFFWIALIISIIYLVRIILKKTGFNTRFYLISILLLFAIFNSTMSGSTFRQFYMPEDPFDESETIPHFYVQRLAYDYYLEGDYEKAEKLINRNIKHLNDLIADEDSGQYNKDIDIQNLEQSKKDLTSVKKRSWTTFTPLIPMDRHLD